MSKIPIKRGDILKIYTDGATRDNSNPADLSINIHQKKNRN